MHRSKTNEIAQIKRPYDLLKTAKQQEAQFGLFGLLGPLGVDRKWCKETGKRTFLEFKEEALPP